MADTTYAPNRWPSSRTHTEGRMATSITNRLTLKGKSGKAYDFEVYPWGQEFRPVGGLYVVLQQPADGVIYIGQTGDLSVRFDAHHKAACFSRYGARFVGARTEPSEDQRLAIEADLIASYRPPCNEQGK